MISLAFTLLFLVTSANAWAVSPVNRLISRTFRTVDTAGAESWGNVKKVGATVICLAGMTMPFPGPAYSANDALTAAQRAMTEKKDKGEAQDRPFNELNEAGKKRTAIAMCKEDPKRKAAGFPSSAACTEAVMKGNFAVAFPSDAFANSKILRATSGATSGTQSVSSAPTTSTTKALQKVTDLSDLPPAAKKRRAAAACKKAEIRKFTRIGSESKCTSTVLSGDYDSVIEAIEYGI
mmetsp:Transcript_27501/g.46314  ORF Transcript_27501/g.46314 Transcript_27501/m.46314 type:complete len:236 (+) Transcript_27501:20-727(+)